MSMKKVYICDLCHEKSKEPSDFVGLKFTSSTTFLFSDANKTDGTHICYSCLEQLKTEIYHQQPNSKRPEEI